MSQEKSKTMHMQIFGGLKRCIMGFVQVENLDRLCVPTPGNLLFF